MRYTDGGLDAELSRTSGEMFESWMCIMLGRVTGRVITPYRTKEEQFTLGENDAGIEMKNDKRMKETGNVYLEFAELGRDGKMYASGPYRDDPNTTYFIGDFNECFWMSKSVARLLISDGIKNGRRVVPAHDKGSGVQSGWGVLIPVEEMRRQHGYVFKGQRLTGDGYFPQFDDDPEIRSIMAERYGVHFIGGSKN